MKKKKFDLTSDLVCIEDKENNINITTSKNNKEKKILLTLSVDEVFRAEFKSWCARHNLIMSEAIVKSFSLLKDKYGP